ncbi:MAG: CRTAC1 family protein [Terriglobia bacterium]
MRRRQFLEIGSSGLFWSPAKAFLAQTMSSRGVRPAPRPKFSGRPFPVTLLDVSQQAGLTAPTIYGRNDVKEYIYEANGPGIAFFDYDHDGWPDIFVPGGCQAGNTANAGSATNRLYHNNRDGTFTDVTARSGLLHPGWCYGVCIGDYDNDGHDDLFLTYYGKNRLYRNNGDGTFTDVTEKAGLAPSEPRFSTGCTFLDYDLDGRLDLFVSRYIGVDKAGLPAEGKNRYCQFMGVPVACGPLGLPQETCSLYHNNGDGTFTDVTRKAGIDKPGGRYGLTAVAFDWDHDGWPDIFVACDSSPNLLFHNRRDGTFSEIGMDLGIAVNGDGQPQANMGVAVGDYDEDGWEDVFITHFSGDTPILFHGVRGQFFDDVTSAAGLAVETAYVGWGTGFADLDNDGWLDIFEVTGSIYPEVERIHADYPFKTPRLVFRNLGNGTFEEVTSLCGPAAVARHSSRGCAFGDFNNDGRIDAVVLNMGEVPSLLRNEGAGGNHWLNLKLVGTKSNRSGIGARITLTAGERRQTRQVLSGSSYISQSDLRQHFGLGAAARAEEIVVHWPSGRTDRFTGIEGGRFLLIEEGGLMKVL